MFAYLLGMMAITIYNQTYGSGTVIDALNKYSTLAETAMNMTAFTAIITTIKSLAIAITVLLYLIDLSEKVTEKNFSIQQFYQATLRMVVSCMFINNADIIVGYLMDIGASVAETLDETDSGMDFFTDDVDAAAHKTMLINGIMAMNKADILAYIATSLVPWILSMIGNIIIQIIMISRILEIIVTTIFAPLAIADIYREGTASPGVRYMKKALALGLQVAVILLINLATQSIISNINGLSSAKSITDYLQPLDGVKNTLDNLKSGKYYYAEDGIVSFLTGLTTKGSTYKVLGIMCARIGLIWNSLSVCEEITGAR